MSDDEQLETLWQRARAALDSESFDEALQFYLEAAKITPERAWPWVYAAHCHEELGNLDDALDKLRKAEAIAPGNWKTQRYIGRVLRDLGRSAEAEAPLRRATENDPEAISLIYLFSVLSRLGRDEEAEEAVRQALALEPENDEGHYNLGVALRFRNEDIDAEVHFRRAIELDSDYMVAYAELGFVLQATHTMGCGRGQERGDLALIGNHVIGTGRFGDITHCTAPLEHLHHRLLMGH
jgi:tetratricopeptide (TPR) repeat protein